MGIARIDFNRDQNIGLYGFATDSYCLTGHLEKRKINEMEENLGVRALKTRTFGTELIGIFCAGNSNGVVTSDRLFKNELATIKSSLNALVLKTNYTALGNLILSNDKGCIISEKISKYKDQIQDFLGVKTEISTICGLDLVGSLAISNNKGCLVSKESSEKEKHIIEKTLKVKPMSSTINYGSSFVKSGVITNSNGVLIGYQTTGPEIQLITESLGFI